MTHFATSLQYFEREPSDEAGGIDRDCDVCQRQEKEHDVVRNDTICSNGAIMYFSPADSQDGQKKEISHEWCCYEVHWEPETHENAGLSILSARRVLWEFCDS